MQKENLESLTGKKVEQDMITFVKPSDQPFSLLLKASAQLYYGTSVNLHTPESDKTRLTYDLDLLPMLHWNWLLLARQAAVSML